jgi:hypothetical protein
MSGGAEVAHAVRFLAEGRIGAFLGLAFGIWAAPPRDCEELGHGLLQCTNKVGQEFISTSSTPLSAEWIGAIAGFVVIGAILGWAAGAGWNALNGRQGA